MSALYTFTSEQEQLRGIVRDLVGGTRSARAIYDAKAPAPDAALWAGLVEIGAAGLGIDEADGGSGGGVLDQLVVAEELGRAVAPVGFVASAVAVHGIRSAKPGENRSRWLSAIADGSVVAAVALDDPGLVYDASGATLLVVPSDEATLGIVEAPTIDALAAVDRTRPLAACHWEERSVARLEGGATAEDLRHLQRSLYAAEAVGVAARALSMTAEHTKDRRQFGLPIGTFQAVKHKLADMLVDVECGRSAAYAAAWALHDGADPTLPAHMAQAVATEAATRVASTAIQLHGGIGVTWEHDLHLLLRRAKALELALGHPGWHVDQIATSLLGPMEAG